MTIQRSIGIIAVILAVVAYFLPEAAALLAVTALVLATVAAVRHQPLPALATVVLVALKMFFVEPTLWLLVLGDVREGDRTVDAIRVFLFLLMLAPVVAIGVNHIESRVTDKVIAAVAMLSLAAFIAVMIIHVPQLPMILVFVLAFVLGAFDFWRDVRGGDRPEP